MGGAVDHRLRQAAGGVAQTHQLAICVVVCDGAQGACGAARADLDQPVGGIVDRELGDRRDALPAVVEGVVAETRAVGAVVQQQADQLVVLVSRERGLAVTCCSDLPWARYFVNDLPTILPSSGFISHRKDENASVTKG